MFSRLRRPLTAHRVARPAAVLAVLLLAAPATAQNPDLTAIFLGSSPKATFDFKWNNEKHTRNVGLLAWDVPLSQFSTAGFDRNFRTFCAEALVGVVAGRTYRFELQVPEAPVAYDLQNTQEGRDEAFRRAKYVRELFGRYYPAALKEDDPDAGFAFQVALWEIIHEGQLPENPVAPFSLFSGTFQADYPNLARSPLFVQRAEGYLQALTGDDNVFYANPALAGLELVRLTGLAGFAGEAAAQSQFALRSVLGGAAGAGGGGGLGAGGLPVGGVGFPGAFGGIGPRGGVGGFPGGFAGGGFPFLPLGGGGSPSTVVPNVPVGSTSGGSPPSSVNTPPSTVPPVNQPTSSSSSSTSSGGTTSSGTSSGVGSTTSGTTSGRVGSTSTSSGGAAVPAPPGVLLGVLVIGAVAGRRVLAQLRQPKANG